MGKETTRLWPPHAWFAVILDKNIMENNVTVPVSVVIPCFRCSASIGRAVESIVQQTKKPAEVILIDDASGDCTLAVLQQLEQTYPGWIKVLRFKQNMGAASARNAGWQMASQRYVAFLDADDSWHPEKLHIQYEYMRKNPTVAASGHLCVLARGEQVTPKIPLATSIKQIQSTELIFRNVFPTPTVMLQRDIPIRFSESQRYAEDLHLWQQIAFSGLSIVRIESPLAYVHKALYGESGLSSQLWKMERGELGNLITLYQQHRINWILLIFSMSFSIVKYVKRVIYAFIKHMFFSKNKGLNAI